MTPMTYGVRCLCVRALTAKTKNKYRAKHTQADGEVDYEKLVKSFGSSLITEDVVARVERVTGRRAHRFLRRGLFFSHRDLTQVRGVEAQSATYICASADRIYRVYALRRSKHEAQRTSSVSNAEQTRSERGALEKW